MYDFQQSDKEGMAKTQLTTLWQQFWLLKEGRAHFWLLRKGQGAAPSEKRKTWTLFGPHGCLLNNVCLHVPYLPLKFVPIFMGHPV